MNDADGQQSQADGAGRVAVESCQVTAVGIGAPPRKRQAEYENDEDDPSFPDMPPHAVFDRDARAQHGERSNKRQETCPQTSGVLDETVTPAHGGRIERPNRT